MHTCLRSIALVLALVIVVGPAHGQGREKTLRLDDVATISHPANWQQVGRVRNEVEFVVPAARQRGAVSARIQVTTEARRDHAEAVRRLREIALEQGEPSRFVVIDGWPALERQRTAPLPVTGDEIVEKPVGPVQETIFATVAIAAGASLVRVEGVLSPGADKKIADEILAVGRGIKSKVKGDAEKARSEIAEVERAVREHQVPPNPEPSTHPHEAPPAAAGGARIAAGPGVPTAIQSGNGELEVAVSNDGQNVVVAANSGYANSTTGGAAFTARGGLAVSFPRDGDPSLAFGNSGAFYYGFISYPNGTAAAGGVTGCADSLAVSTDQGVTFPFRSHAVLCPNTGSVCFPDQEHIAADPRNSAPGGDQVYFTWRNFTPAAATTSCSFGSGFVTPRIVCSADGGTTWPTTASVGTGDFPRISLGSDGFVYVVYLSGANVMLNKFSSCSAGLAAQAGFPVTVASLVSPPCPVPGLDRCNNGNTLASPTVAIDDLNPGHVYVAYATSTGAGNENVIVRDSTDGGLTFPRSVVVNSAASARRFMPWVCATGGAAFVAWYDRRNATSTNNDLTRYFGGSAMAKAGSLVAGSEIDISGVDDTQCSTWPCAPRSTLDCSSCTTTVATTCPATTGSGCPKYGDYNGAACGSGRRYNAWASAVPPAGVTAPAPGIDVYANATPVPGDFYIRDWTTSAASHDPGDEPSTNPYFYTSSDVWNQQASGTPAAPVNDWVAGDPVANAGGPPGNNNFAFVRVSRRTAAAPTAPSVTVPISFLKADYGLGTNYAVVATASMTFAAGDLTKTLTPGAGWRLESGASAHICLAAEIDVPPDDGVATPSLNGGAPGPNDFRITQDNNKAQRNLGTVALPGASGGAAYYAIIHNAMLETRDLHLEVTVPARAARRLPDVHIGVIGDQSRPLGEHVALELKGMEPGEFRWFELAIGPLDADEGEPLPISIAETHGGRVVNGFTVVVQPSRPDAALREALRRQQVVLDRFAVVRKESRASREAAAVGRLLKNRDVDERHMLAFARERIAPVLALLLQQIEAEPTSSSHVRELARRIDGSAKTLRQAVDKGDARAVVAPLVALFEQVDTYLTMLQKSGGDEADVLQMVRWQEALLTARYQQVPEAEQLDGSARRFVASFGNGKAGAAAYQQFLADNVPLLTSVTKRIHDASLDAAMAELAAATAAKHPAAALERAHRAFLLQLEKATG